MIANVPSGKLARKGKAACPGLEDALATAPKVTPPSIEAVNAAWKLLSNSPSIQDRNRLPRVSNCIVLAVTARPPASDALRGMLNETPRSQDRVTTTCCATRDPNSATAT